MVRIKDLLKRENKLDNLHEDISRILNKHDMDATDALVALYLLLENIHKNIKKKDIDINVDPLKLLEMHNNHIHKIRGYKPGKKNTSYIG